MKKIILLNLFLSFCLLNNAQINTFQDEISRNQITTNKLNAISYQDVRRFPFTKTVKNSTSFFITKNCLLTSAHNVTKLPLHSVKKITIFPSRIRGDKYLDSIIIDVQYRKHINYPKNYCFYFPRTRKPNDMALIYVPDSIIENNLKLKSLYYLPILEYPQSLIKGDTIYCAGYPAENEYNGQYVMSMDTSIVKHLGKNHFEHDLKTLRGNSGSPIMVKRDNKFYVVGINSIKYNGTWLNEEKQKIIKEWIILLKERNK